MSTNYVLQKMYRALDERDFQAIKSFIEYYPYIDVSPLISMALKDSHIPDEFIMYLMDKSKGVPDVGLYLRERQNVKKYFLQKYGHAGYESISRYKSFNYDEDYINSIDILELNIADKKLIQMITDYKQYIEINNNNLDIVNIELAEDENMDDVIVTLIENNNIENAHYEREIEKLESLRHLVKKRRKFLTTLYLSRTSIYTNPDIPRKIYEYF